MKASFTFCKISKNVYKNGETERKRLSRMGDTQPFCFHAIPSYIYETDEEFIWKQECVPSRIE